MLTCDLGRHKGIIFPRCAACFHTQLWHNRHTAHCAKQCLEDTMSRSRVVMLQLESRFIDSCFTKPSLPLTPKKWQSKKQVKIQGQHVCFDIKQTQGREPAPTWAM